MKLIKKKKQLSCERYYREREKKRGTEGEGGREKARKRERGIMGKAFRTLHTIYLLFFVFHWFSYLIVATCRLKLRFDSLLKHLVSTFYTIYVT